MNSSHLGLFCFFHDGSWKVNRVVKNSIGLELGLPRWLSGKESACSVGGAGAACLIPGSGRSPGGGHSSPFQYCCLENPMDRGAWKPPVRRITQSQTRLKWPSTALDRNRHIAPSGHLATGKNCMEKNGVCPSTPLGPQLTPVPEWSQNSKIQDRPGGTAPVYILTAGTRHLPQHCYLFSFS